VRIEILTRIGFEKRTQTPGAVLAVPGDASLEEAIDWISRGLARELPDEKPSKKKGKE